jgi:phage baseplate assembly protein W
MADDRFHRDLWLTDRAFDQVLSDRDKVDLGTTPTGDVATVTGRANLAQAIVNRLFTRQGELARLGHPTYGSRLHSLIGERNVTRARGLAEIYIRESLGQEPRIAEIVEIGFEPPSRGQERSTMRVEIVVRPADDERPLSLVLPIGLGG